MKYLKQFFIIIIISFLGEGLSALIPLPVPASIYGILILFMALVTKILPLEAVKETGHFLVEIMPLMFLPPAVGVMESWNLIQKNWLPYVIVVVVTTIFVMAVSGWVTQYFVKRGERKK